MAASLLVVPTDRWIGFFRMTIDDGTLSVWFRIHFRPPAQAYWWEYSSEISEATLWVATIRVSQGRLSETLTRRATESLRMLVSHTSNGLSPIDLLKVDCNLNSTRCLSTSILASQHLRGQVHAKMTRSAYRVLLLLKFRLTRENFRIHQLQWRCV